MGRLTKARLPPAGGLTGGKGALTLLRGVLIGTALGVDDFFDFNDIFIVGTK